MANKTKVGLQESTKDINANDIVKPYFRKWGWFLASILFMMALAFLYLKTATPIYNITSTVLIKDTKKSPSGSLAMLSDVSGFGNMGTNSIENEMIVFKSKKLMKEVVEDLGVQISLYSKQNLSKVELYGTSSPIIIEVINEKEYNDAIKYPVEIEISGDKIELQSKELSKITTTYNKTIGLPYANIMIRKNPDFLPSKNKITDLNFVFSRKEAAVNAYQGALGVKLVDKDGTVIELSIKSPNKEKGKDILKNLVDAYNNDATNDKNSESQKTKDFIDERVNIIANELGEVENRKEVFKRANNITDIQGEASMNLGKAMASRKELLETESQILLVNDLISYMSRVGNNQTLPSSVGLNNPTASANINAYNELILQRNNLLENATPQNPLVTDLTKQINNLKSAVNDGLYKYKSALQFSKNRINVEQSETDAKILKIPAQERLFRDIERQQQIKENLYLILLEKREETAISLAMTAPKAKVVDEAFSSSKPASPKKMFTLLGAILAGFLIPFVFIYLKELFNNTIRSKHDLEKLTTVPIIGELPRIRKSENQLVGVNDMSPMAEAFRILITNMNFLLPKKEKGKVVFVTSSIKGEGKTFTSVNLALTLASPKHKVLIIGADIRNPQLQRYNTSRKGLDGLTEFLYNSQEKIQDIIHVSTFNPNLDVIYSGTIPPNPTELLSNGRYQVLMDQLKEIYNYIIVDTAPLMLVTDTFLTSDLADTTIYVTRSGFTEKQVIDFANKQVNSKKIKNAAFVLNDVDKSNFGYGNKYGYGYSKEDKSFLKKLKDKF